MTDHARTDPSGTDCPGDDHPGTDHSGDAPQVLATRRTVLRGAMLTGVTLPFLAACGGGSTSGDSGAGSPTAAGNGGAGGAIATTSDVPQGGGLIIDNPKVVITQPAPGQFKAFSSTCTHRGCTVNDVSGGTINCPCHGSMYSIKDGSVVGGPAPAPLPEEQISVKGKNISLKG